MNEHSCLGVELAAMCAITFVKCYLSTDTATELLTVLLTVQ
jgi:hypothetical protein